MFMSDINVVIGTMVQQGQTFIFPGDRRDSHTITDVERNGDEVELDFEPPIVGLGTSASKEELTQRLDPREIHDQRSPEAQIADEAKDAPLTTDPLKYASDPSGTDFPGVDTGPTFEDVEGEDFDTDSFVEDELGIADVEDRFTGLGDF